jgi:hypothetical protein
MNFSEIFLFTHKVSISQGELTETAKIELRIVAVQIQVLSNAKQLKLSPMIVRLA